jgi:hypothetical protein
MPPTVRRHLVLATSLSPLTFARPMSVTLADERASDERHRAERARDARIVHEDVQRHRQILRESYTSYSVTEAGAREALVDLESSSEIGELVTIIEESPVEFALRFRALEQRLAELEAKHGGLSARVGP